MKTLTPNAETIEYVSPKIKYYKTRAEFDIAVGKDFIDVANFKTQNGNSFLVGLSHGASPSGAYKYILENYKQLKKPDLIRYTYVNSPSKRQQSLKDIINAENFLHELLDNGLIVKHNILGSSILVGNIEDYANEFNIKLGAYLKENKKTGLDYVFLATNPEGHVANITRNSEIFDSENILEIVEVRKQKRLTVTPFFLKKSRRIAFLATKADKRRPLVWLLDYHSKINESPSFLRFIPEVEKRLTIYIDDEALTWPQIEIKRKTRLGTSTIRVDLAKPYNENAIKKLPVIVMIHGFLGLNSFDGMLTYLPSQKYIAAAMHYGSIPSKLEIERYSKHVVNNINAVVTYFGEKGHPVYILDHSMGNIYFMMIDKEFNRLEGIQKFLKGRIGTNPFFGLEAKHAVKGFLDTVILPSLSLLRNPIEKSMFIGFRNALPLNSKKGIRKRGMAISEFLIRRDSAMRDRVWKNMKKRITFLMTKMDSLPHVNRIPIERALNRLPPKIFVIQVYGALLESINFDNQEGLPNMEKHKIPILIFKSERDSIAKFQQIYYKGANVTVKDITNEAEKDKFKEHLYHMVFQNEMLETVQQFIDKTEG